MWTRRLLVCLALLIAALPALAFDRPFPSNTKRGQMTPGLHPTIFINGKARTLSAGAQIRNENNLIEQPASLRGEGFIVNYTETPDGNIDRVWILTRDEARQPIKTQ